MNQGYGQQPIQNNQQPMMQPMGGFGGPVQPQKSNNNVIIVVVILILVAAIGALLFILLNDKKDDDSADKTTTTTVGGSAETTTTTTFGAIKTTNPTDITTTTRAITTQPSGSADKLVCKQTVSIYDYTYTYEFSGNSVSKIGISMYLDAGSSYTSDSLKQEADMVKSMYEGQGFVVDYTISGTTITFNMEIAANDAINAGLIPSATAQKSQVKAALEAKGATCK